MESSPSPAISVIVATIEPWPGVQACLDRLAPQVRSTGAELILADGTPDGSGSPPAGVRDRYGSLQTLAEPGSSVFTLRAKGARRSTAPILAFTEDHCEVGADWVPRLLDAHREHPDRDMVSGCVTNGSSDGLVDWANFLMTFAEFLPPAPARPLKRVPPMSNASFRRRALLGGDLPEGWLELVLAPTLVHERRMHFDGAISVGHVQPLGLARACASHFHNGRSGAGLALPHMAWRDWLVRLATVPVMPWILFVSVVRSLKGREVPRRARRSLPVVWLLAAAHACGELAGLLSGAGASAKRLN
jgi:hypothetical protein